jgi:hypothetical protein
MKPIEIAIYLVVMLIPMVILHFIFNWRFGLVVVAIIAIVVGGLLVLLRAK